MNHLFFITIAGKDVGYGHLNRCLTLAAEANKKNLSIHFFLIGDEKAALQIQQAGFDYLVKPFSAFSISSIKSWVEKFHTHALVMLDLSHSVIFDHQENLMSVLEYLRDCMKHVMIIDSLNEPSIATLARDVALDAIIVPYVGGSLQKNETRFGFVGPAYAILAEAYSNLPPRVIHEQASRLLISCGGSDPKKLTLLMLAGVENCTDDLTIQVIVGPLFDDELKLTLKNIVTASKHAITLIEAPASLRDYMIWCDLALTTSSTIKYELAATGTPAILVSIDEDHQVANQPFSRIGSTVDLGINVTPLIIEQQVNTLLADRQARERMAAAGQRTVDGKGTERIINEMTRRYCATE
jgi:UDP-2,4-diacetamido-2,4,6-trideoxy-beta-L-altropyranose hydrolase